MVVRHAHALNLKDSGVKDIVIGLRKDSSSIKKAQNDGFKVLEVKDAVKDSDICMILVPDELQADLYNDFLFDNLKRCMFIICSWTFHSFPTYKTKKRFGCFYDCPKGPGHTVRAQYLAGGGVLVFGNTSRLIRKCVDIGHMLLPLAGGIWNNSNNL